MHNLISYIGTTGDHQTSTIALHSPDPVPASSSDKKVTATDQDSAYLDKNETGKEEDDEEKERMEGGVEKEDREGEGEGDKLMKCEASPEFLMVEVEKWRSALSYTIDSQDTQTTEKV